MRLLPCNFACLRMNVSLCHARWLGCLALLFFAINTQAERKTPNSHSNPESDITFEKQIRPILKANCIDCHGEGEKLKGDLDLRLRRLMVKGGESGAAIEPGKPEKSLLYQK